MKYDLAHVPCTVLPRSGLCCVLWRPGSDSDATCWSDTKPTQNTIILPVGHCHQSRETWWGEGNRLPGCLFCNIQLCFVQISNLIQGLKNSVILRQEDIFFFKFCFASSSFQTVEERRTVRDSQGKEETTVTRSGGPGSLEGPEPQTAPLVPGQWVCLTLTKMKVPTTNWHSQCLLTCFIYWLIFFLRWPTSIFRHAGWRLLILQVLWGV